jgi:hypothetical protein
MCTSSMQLSHEEARMIMGSRTMCTDEHSVTNSHYDLGPGRGGRPLDDGCKWHNAAHCRTVALQGWLSGHTMISLTGAASEHPHDQSHHGLRHWQRHPGRDRDGPRDPAAAKSMETEITQLVSEVFVCRQARDTQQEQLMRGNTAAVREAILLHARPVLITSASPGCEPLSASHWKLLSSILASLMPVFWFSVIKGLWGSVKVLVT